MNSSEPLDFSQLPDVSDEYPDPDPEEQLIAVAAAHEVAPIEEDDYMPGLLADYLDYRDMNNEEPISGWGIELVISTRNSYDWAPDLLMSLVKYLLFNEHSQMILPGHRLPLGSSIGSAVNSGLNHLLAVTSPEYPSNIQLPGGLCSLIHVIGVTEAEVERARTLKGPRGSLALQRVLEKFGVGCVTDPDRSCVTTHPQFEQAWREAESGV